VHVEDHPFDYGSFSGTIPKGQYGAGEVRIFDSGTYEVLEQEPGKLTFRLNGERRMRGVWHLFQTRKKSGNEKDWLVRIREDERPEPAALPELVPMLATLAKEPFDDDGWIFEPKWDGVRALVTCGIEETMVVSRTGRDITATYPELAKLHDRVVAIDAIVDGEIVAMERGRPSFERLQSRINLQNPHDIARIAKQIPVSFVAYDILYIDGRSLLKAPLEERKQLLAEAIVVSDTVQISPVIPGEGITLFEAARAQRLEGIVAKKLGCSYRPGRRAKDWIKIKTVMEADLVIGGWSPGEGNRSSTFGALIVGAYDGEGLRFVGSVGTGFDQRALEDLIPRLKDLETDKMPFVVDPRKAPGGSRFGKPIRDPHWVRPELVGSVEFRELTSVGRLRAPSFKGLRPDKAPEDCSFADLARLAGIDA
ncbi:MAG: non-homologous end-joining DNA ligase, partial [Actinomycetota bacterium]|nr:non-homologous end-joining DNA ligase [Actinomycetota bacterium]